MQIISFFVNLWSHSSEDAPSHLREWSEDGPRMVRVSSVIPPLYLRLWSDSNFTENGNQKQNGVTINRPFLRLIFNINLEFCLN